MRRRRLVSAVAAVLLVGTTAGCGAVVLPGGASPAFVRPSAPDPDQLPELEAPDELPTTSEFEERIDEALATGEIPDHDYLDFLVDGLTGEDPDDPDTRLAMGMVLSSVRRLLNAPEQVDTGSGASPASSDAIDWRPCPSDTSGDGTDTQSSGGPSTDGMECGELLVPVDWDDPDGQTLTIAMDRFPARKPDERIGVLMANPGGPGGSGVDFLPFWYDDLSDDIRDRFDVMSFDPRGVGQSDPVQCGSPPEPFEDVDDTPDTEQEEKDFVEEMQKVAAGCENGAADLLAHVGTSDVAHDMEAMREAMGEDQLSFVGYSYGTMIGQVYANAYPDRVRAFVLDGVMDPALNLQELDAEQIRAFDAALRRFEKTCPDVCGGLAEYVLDESEKSDIETPVNDWPADPTTVRIAVLSLLYSEADWPVLAMALRQAAVEDDSTLLTLAADDYSGRNVFTGDWDSSGDAYDAVMCRDFASDEDVHATFVSARQQARLYPVFAGSPRVLCNEWPVEAAPAGALDWPKDTPVLLVSTTGDPATPHSMGQAVAERTGAPLLTHDGEGHTVYADGIDCIDDKVNAFLLDGTEPKPGTICKG